MNKAYDIIVAGAGPSGLAAAISAARQGAHVLLVDQRPCPGGMNTTGLVGPLMSFHARGRQVVKGLPQEVIDRLAARGGTLGHIPDPIGMASTITPVDPEQLKLVYFEMLAEQSTLTLLPDTLVTGLEKQDGRITGLWATNKSGCHLLKAPQYVDATGDGDLAALAGETLAFGRGQDGFAQPMSLIFRVAGVDMDAVARYMRANPGEFVLSPEADLDTYVAVSGFFSQVRAAQESGELTVPRDRVLFFQTLRRDEILVNMSRMVKFSALDAQQMQAATATGYRQVDEILHFFKKYLPGFGACRLHSIAASVGVRESRRLVGKRLLEMEDILQNRAQPDSVAVCSYPIDIHDPTGGELVHSVLHRATCYDIPYGVMLPCKTHNLLVTGRCISASHEALASARISVTAMSLGEAAGLAAALCAQTGTPPAALDVSRLQALLWEQGAIPGKDWLEAGAEGEAPCKQHVNSM